MWPDKHNRVSCAVHAGHSASGCLTVWELTGSRSLVEPRLPQFDLFGDLMRQADAADGQHHFRRQLFVALEAAAATASRTAFSISRCEVMPTFLRKPRRLVLNMSSFMMVSLTYGRVGLLSMYSPRLRCRLSARELALARWTSRSLRQIDIVRRAGGMAAGAERVVVAAGVGHGRLSALEATREQGREEEEWRRGVRRGYVACVIHSSGFVIAGLDPAIHQNQGIFLKNDGCPGMGECVVIPGASQTRTRNLEIPGSLLRIAPE